MINLSIKTLEKYNACQDAKDWFANSKTKTLEDAYNQLIKENHLFKYQWTSWIVARLLNKNNKIKYAIYAAEQVIHIFEKQYPNDNRPREAINAIKAYLKNPTKENKEKCKIAAKAAYYAAYYAAADAAADAYCAAYYAAASAAFAASYAAAAYAAASLAGISSDEMYNKIIRYGIKLLNNNS